MPHLNPTLDQSATGFKRQIELERDGEPFVVHPQADGNQVLLPLVGHERITGRGDQVDLPIDGDEEVSRLHAELVRVGGSWVGALSE